MRVLIDSLIPYDSRKTTTVLSLAKALKKIRVDVGFLKPVSGINGWYQFDCIKESLRLGYLVGEDVLKLHEVCPSEDFFELIVG